MAGLNAPCAKGCGGFIDVDEQMVTNMIALGKGLTFAHDTCPTDTPAGEPAPRPRRFRLQVLAYELDPDTDDGASDGAFNVAVDGATLLAGMGTTVEAPSLSKAVNGPMTTWLAQAQMSSGGRMVSAWERFQEQSVWADASSPTPPS